MTTEVLLVDNLKCSGCANTIKSQLQRVPGISNVYVNTAKSSVEVEYSGESKTYQNMENVMKKLGYVRIGTSKFTDRMKSYVSCAIGKLQKETNA